MNNSGKTLLIKRLFILLIMSILVGIPNGQAYGVTELVSNNMLFIADANNSGGNTLDIITIDDDISPFETVNNHISFNDLKGHWAEPNINTLIQKGAISGYPDGSFRPDQTISRAEFVTVLVKAFNMDLQAGKAFSDTQSHWAKDYISTAYNQGVVKGINANEFAPDAKISREQMAIMIVNAAKLTNSEANLEFVDKQQISSWAIGAVVTAAEKKIIKGYPDNTFRPQGNASRAEAVSALINAL